MTARGNTSDETTAFLSDTRGDSGLPAAYNPVPSPTAKLVTGVPVPGVKPKMNSKTLMIGGIVVLGLASLGFLIALLVLIRKEPKKTDDGKCEPITDHSMEYMAVFMLIICVMGMAMLIQSYRFSS